MEYWSGIQLRFLHAEDALISVKLEYFRRISTDDIKVSLKPGEQGSLRARPDGTILDGYHRIRVLIECGEEVNHMPREVIEKES